MLVFLVSRDRPISGYEGKKQFALFESVAHFETWSQSVPPLKRCFYEVIQGHRTQKLKFDIDSTNVEQAEQEFPMMLKAIEDTFYNVYKMRLTPRALVTCTSHSDAKRSWHIIINGYCVSSNVQAKAFYNKVWEMAPKTKTETGNPCLDPNVYSSLQHFRLLGSAKQGSNRVKVSKHNLEQTLITNIQGCVLLPNIEVPTSKAKKSPVQQYEKMSEEEVIDVLDRLRPDRWDQYSSWISIGMALKVELGIAGLDLWKYYSDLHSSKYDEQEHNRKWKSFEKTGATTMGTLIHWAVKDTSRPALAIAEIYSEIEEYVNEMDDSDDHSYDEEDDKNSSDDKPTIYCRGRYFAEIRKIMSRPVTINEIMQFLKETLACAVNGGRLVYISKNFADGVIEYSILTAKNLRDFSFQVTNDNLKSIIEKHANAKDADLERIIKKHKTKQISLPEILDIHKHQIMYDRIVFVPYVRYSDFVESTRGEHLFNLFTGFRAQPIHNLHIDKSLISPIMWHIKHVLCNQDEAATDYMLNWLAHLCQKPNRKIGVMVALKSQQGAGKNIFWDFIGEYIIGMNYYIVLNNLGQVTDKFNALMQGKLLTVCDEIGNFGVLNRSHDTLKNIITQLKQVIELKGHDAFRINDYNNLVGLSNNECPWKVESSDRRYFILEVSDCKVDDDAYFGNLANCFNDQCAMHFYNMLLQRDISQWKPLKIPMTETKRTLKHMSLLAPIQYIFDCVQSDAPYGFAWDSNGPTKVFSQNLFEGFQEWQKATGSDRKEDAWSSQNFKICLHNIKLKPKEIRVDGKKRRGFLLDREEIKSNIRAYTKDEDLEFDE
jgi:hypothetical protein